MIGFQFISMPLQHVLIHIPTYFAPEEKERFDVSMSGKLEGIGASVCKRKTIIPKSPN
jgi:C-terminal processing protease CtpA/Prc